MSRATKRKHVIKEVWLDNLELPKEGQQIVRVVAGRGNNLHEVEDASGALFLVSMPTKYRRNVWIKRGDFVLVEPILEGDKVKAEIVLILTAEHIHYYRTSGNWPKAFEPNIDVPTEGDLFVNTNRPPVEEVTSSSDSSDGGTNDDEIDSDSDTAGK